MSVDESIGFEGTAFTPEQLLAVRDGGEGVMPFWMLPEAAQTFVVEQAPGDDCR